MAIENLSSRQRGRPLDEAKAALIRVAAAGLFMEHGYEGTSLDAIAARAGVSKLTIYRHFGGKEELFAAVLRAKCEEMLGDIPELPATHIDAESALLGVGYAFVTLVTDPGPIAAHQLVARERHRVPGLAQLYFDNTVAVTSRRIARLVEALRNRGDLTVVDSEQAAKDLMTLWRHMPVLHAELGIEPLNADALQAHVERTTKLLLRAWANSPEVIPQIGAVSLIATRL